MHAVKNRSLLIFPNSADLTQKDFADKNMEGDKVKKAKSTMIKSNKYEKQATKMQIHIASLAMMGQRPKLAY